MLPSAALDDADFLSSPTSSVSRPVTIADGADKASAAYAGEEIASLVSPVSE